MSKLLAPNGKPSNLTPEQYKLVRSSAFKKWFGDWETSPETASKILDSNGEPLPVYHGSNKKIDSFRADENQYVYFTNDINLADKYAIHRSKKSNGEKFIYDIYLKIINPLIIDANFESWDYISTKSIENSDIAVKYLLKRGVERITTNQAPKIAIKNGFDGVIISNIYDGVGYGKDAELSNVYVALHPNQIKLADGTNTIFDGDNPDIRFEYGGNLLLAPNGKPSNLNPEQYKLVRSSAFKKWFGDWEKDPKKASKVIDSNGEPLIVFHGSPTGKRFNIFKSKYNLFFFASEKNVAKNQYSSSSSDGVFFKDSRVFDVFLNIRNPYTIDAENREYCDINHNFDNENYEILEDLAYGVSNYQIDDSEIYDGLIAKRVDEEQMFGDYGKNAITDVYVSFSPNQIKIADGTNTTFDNSNVDIRFDDGGGVEEIYYIPTDKSKEIITDFTHYKSGENYYPITQWANWFISQDRKSKEYIANSISNSNKLRNAFISNWYDDYKIKNNDLTFEEFLNKDIEVYRGQTSRDLKYGQSFGFDSYTTDKSLAEHFARDGNGLVIKKNVKPKETYGLIQSIGNEKEVMIPAKFSDDFLQKEWYDLSNKNMKIFDNLSDKDMTEFDELENSKNYQGLIDKLKDMLNIKSDNNFEKGGEVNTGLFSQIWGWFGIKF